MFQVDCLFSELRLVKIRSYLRSYFRKYKVIFFTLLGHKKIALLITQLDKFIQKHADLRRVFFELGCVTAVQGNRGSGVRASSRR